MGEIVNIPGLRPPEIQWAYWDEVVNIEQDAIRLSPVRIEWEDICEAAA